MGGYGTYLGFRIRFSDDVVRNTLQYMLIDTNTLDAVLYCYDIWMSCYTLINSGGEG